MEVVVTETTVDPAGVEKSGAAEKSGNIIATRHVDRFIAMVDGYASGGTLIEAPDEIMEHFLYTYAAWPTADFFSDLTADVPADCRTLGTRIGNMTEGGGLAAAFDNDTSDLSAASAKITKSTADTRTSGTVLGNMTEGGGLSAAFNNATETAANSAKKSFALTDLRTLGTVLGDMTEGGGLAAAFDNTTSQVSSASAKKTITATDLRTLGIAIGTMVENGALAAAFDNVTSQTAANSAARTISSASLRGVGTTFGSYTYGAGGNAAIFDGVWNCTYDSANASYSYISTSGGIIGKDWGVGITRTITAFEIWAPNNTRFVNALGNIRVRLQGSQNNSTWDTLYDATDIVSSIGQHYVVNSGITATTAYRYHRIYVSMADGSGSHRFYMAEADLFEAPVLADCKGIVGKDWGDGIERVISSFSLYPSSDKGFLSNGGTVDIKLYGYHYAYYPIARKRIIQRHGCIKYEHHRRHFGH